MPARLAEDSENQTAIGFCPFIDRNLGNQKMWNRTSVNSFSNYRWILWQTNCRRLECNYSPCYVCRSSVGLLNDRLATKRSVLLLVTSEWYHTPVGGDLGATVDFHNFLLHSMGSKMWNALPFEAQDLKRVDKSQLGQCLKNWLQDQTNYTLSEFLDWTV